MTVCMWASRVAMTVTMAMTVAVILTLVTAVMAVAMTVSIHRHWVVTRVTVASRVCSCRLRGMPCCPAHVDHGTRAVLHAVVSVGSAALLHLDSGMHNAMLCRYQQGLSQDSRVVAVRRAQVDSHGGLG
mmetsp:Transcript_37440/g.67685  ORF Transcript_37440/g.67685 Transcript_37440/m.67685 type:complete len:129 (-) Transcript_37440:353-739(-)